MISSILLATNETSCVVDVVMAKGRGLEGKRLWKKGSAVRQRREEAWSSLQLCMLVFATAWAARRGVELYCRRNPCISASLTLTQ
jgi:hypothetical protein